MNPLFNSFPGNVFTFWNLSDRLPGGRSLILVFQQNCLIPPPALPSPLPPRCLFQYPLPPFIPPSSFVMSTKCRSRLYPLAVFLYIYIIIYIINNRQVCFFFVKRYKMINKFKQGFILTTCNFPGGGLTTLRGALM